jgi:hypothetical protein
MHVFGAPLRLHVSRDEAMQLAGALAIQLARQAACGTREPVAKSKGLSAKPSTGNRQESYGITQGERLFAAARAGKAVAGCSYLQLRRAQNAAWAQDSVRKGVQHASDRNYALAIKCYQSAISLVMHS